MKKILTSMLAVVMALELIVSAFTADAVRESRIAFLKDCGLPLSFLEGRDNDGIDALYEVAQAHTIQYVGKQEISLAAAAMSTYGTIPAADMTLTMWLFIVNGGAANNYPILNVTVFIDYLWAGGRPFVVKTDGVAVNWDSSLFAMEPGSFKSADYQYIDIAREWRTAHTQSAPASLNQGGLGYTATLTPLYPFQENIAGRGGSARFTLRPRKPMYDKSRSVYDINVLSASINVEYAHDKTPVAESIAFSYNEFGGVSMSLPVWSDSVATKRILYYQ